MDFLTPRQFAAKIGVSLRQAYRIVERRQVAVYHDCRGRICIPLRDVKHYIKFHRKPESTPPLPPPPS